MGDVRKVSNMLWTIFVVLLVLWALGLITGCTTGGVLHALVIAIVMALVQLIKDGDECDHLIP